MSMDYHRAWQLCRATPPELHHERCSYRTDGLLCDCEVVMQHPEKLDDVMHTTDGKIYTPPPEKHGPRLPYPGEFCLGGDSRHQLVAQDIRPVQLRIPGRGKRWRSESLRYCEECRRTLRKGRLEVCIMSLPITAITIRQPWASLIISAGKNIENRTWHTRYRGPLLIHAGLNDDEAETDDAMHLVHRRHIELPAVPWLMTAEGSSAALHDWHDQPRGGIIGVVDLVDCVSMHESPWFVGPWGFVLANPRPLPFFPCRGKQGFFQVQYPAP